MTKLGICRILQSNKEMLLHSELRVVETAGCLAGRKILVVENEWLIAVDLRRVLVGEGAHVVGPAGSVFQAFALINKSLRIDAAVLDIHLGEGLDVYPLAETLRRREIPFIFATGYDDFGIRSDFAGVPHLMKPFTPTAVGPILAAASLMVHQ